MLVTSSNENSLSWIHFDDFAVTLIIEHIKETAYL